MSGYLLIFLNLDVNITIEEELITVANLLYKRL